MSYSWGQDACSRPSGEPALHAGSRRSCSLAVSHGLSRALSRPLFCTCSTASHRLCCDLSATPPQMLIFFLKGRLMARYLGMRQHLATLDTYFLINCK